MRNRPGQAARIQSGANRSGAVALVPDTLWVALGRRGEDIALGAFVGGARRQLRDEPIGKVQPPVGRFALCAAQVDTSTLKVDVLPPNAPSFVDPGPVPARKAMRSAVVRRFRRVRGFKPGSRAARSVASMTWSRSLRVIARVWSRSFDLAAVEVTVRTWRVASLDSTPLSTA